METVTLLEQTYRVLKNENDALELDTVKDLVTEYFRGFDFIVGDWAYGKLRLKGFNKKTNAMYKAKINGEELIDSYLQKYCAYGCRHFILEKE